MKERACLLRGWKVELKKIRKKKKTKMREEKQMKGKESKNMRW